LKRSLTRESGHLQLVKNGLQWGFLPTWCDLATGIVKLKDAGCQIIVDDIAYYAEVRFRAGFTVFVVECEV
jgi:hypothetical protein